MTAVAIVVVLVIPVATVVALLSVVNRMHARRAERIARQIALTDAIHGVLGPVVAPVVRRGRRGWVGVLAVRAGEPHLELMVAIAQAELGRTAEIMLVPAERPAAGPRRTPAPAALAA